MEVKEWDFINLREREVGWKERRRVERQNGWVEIQARASRRRPWRHWSWHGNASFFSASKFCSNICAEKKALVIDLKCNLNACRIDEARQPLSRKVPIASSKINPYRMVIVLRLVVLGFFLHYRILHPVQDAFGLWLTSVICEIWFAISWILDQFPKWFPIDRETYLDRLSLRWMQFAGATCFCPKLFIQKLLLEKKSDSKSDIKSQKILKKKINIRVLKIGSNWLVWLVQSWIGLKASPVHPENRFCIKSDWTG